MFGALAKYLNAFKFNSNIPILSNVKFTLIQENCVNHEKMSILKIKEKSINKQTKNAKNDGV